MTAKLTAKQDQAISLASGSATHVMLEGGGRSGKSFVHLRNMILRGLKAPGSRHLAARFRFNHIKTSLVAETLPRVMRVCFPGVVLDLDRTDWFLRLPNGSEVWFAGLDDKERTEKILGKEFVSIYLNECSEIPWPSRQMVMTRLAQKVTQTIEGVERPLKVRAYYDCNPPSKAHWTFRLFHQKLDPETREPVPHPEDFVRLQMNPRDNLENISSEYLTQLAGLGARMRRRFEFGEYAEASANALFDEAIIDRWRVMDGDLPDFVRVVVGVDPSGSGDEDNADNDEIGIIVGALGTDGIGYLTEDISIKAGPATWGNVSVEAYMRHSADALVGEVNFGGAMVESTIKVAASGKSTRVNFKKVTASRGKVVRAEPFSALYEQGKVRHVGLMSKLEDEMCAMTTTGYLGTGSPNRADAAIWVLAELFPAIVAGPKVERPKRERGHRGQGAWMG